MDDTAGEAKASPFLHKLRELTDSYMEQHQIGSALFWANQLLGVSQEHEDILRLAEVLLRDRQFNRCSFLLISTESVKVDIRACYLAAKAMHGAKQSGEAAKLFDEYHELIEATKKEIESCTDEAKGQKLRQSVSSMFVLKGYVLEELENRTQSIEAFREALRIDVFCGEAFHALTQHNVMTAAEEADLFKTVPFEAQCKDQEAEMVTFVYKMRMKKYDKPAEDVIPEHFAELALSTDNLVQRAERYFYNCDYDECYKLTSSVKDEDPYHTECLPLHISCQVELNLANDLFQLAHDLVNLYPQWSIAWFAVGTYYYLVGKQEFALRYLSKATHLDRVCGPAWLAYGHAFAVENEHDQAMAAYFKAFQLMKGCHLPLLYIGVEYGLSNNAKLAESFFSKALGIAPEDPYVLHELGVVCFHNQAYEKAEAYFLKALRQVEQVASTTRSSKWEALFNNLGHTSRKLGKFDDALRYHRKALVLQPQSASTISAIAYIHALKGDLIEAVDAFHKALGIRREDTFSTTMLNTVIQQIAEDSNITDFMDPVPKFEPLLNTSDSLSKSSLLALPITHKDNTSTTSFDVEMTE